MRKNFFFRTNYFLSVLFSALFLFMSCSSSMTLELNQSVTGATSQTNSKTVFKVHNLSGSSITMNLAGASVSLNSGETGFLSSQPISGSNMSLSSNGTTVSTASASEKTQLTTLTLTMMVVGLSVAILSIALTAYGAKAPEADLSPDEFNTLQKYVDDYGFVRWDDSIDENSSYLMLKTNGDGKNFQMIEIEGKRLELSRVNEGYYALEDGDYQEVSNIVMRVKEGNDVSDQSIINSMMENTNKKQCFTETQIFYTLLFKKSESPLNLNLNELSSLLDLHRSYMNIARTRKMFIWQKYVRPKFKPIGAIGMILSGATVGTDVGLIPTLGSNAPGKIITF